MKTLYLYFLFLLTQSGQSSSTSDRRHAIENIFDRSSKVQCYGQWGCFGGMSLFGQEEFPYTPEQINLKILLFTRDFRDVPKVFNYTEAAKLKDSGFNFKNPTKMFFHGFSVSCDEYWLPTLRNAFLDRMDVNFFCVDWSDGAAAPHYSKAAATTQLVAKLAAYFIQEMFSVFGDMRKIFHLIGFSMGAHISGNIGSLVPGMSRITGLDPAGPVFMYLDDSKKLDKDDALFVDVIHTNGGYMLQGQVGDFTPCGHVDFYPNGGRSQFNCHTFWYANLRNAIAKIFGIATINRTCNHLRSVEIFIESIPGNCTLNGFPCSTDWEGFKQGYCFDVSTAIPIGLNSNIDPTRRGNFYLATRAEYPFCGTQMKVTISVDDPNGKRRSYKGTVKITFGKRLTRLKENFTLLNGFGTPEVKSRVITVGQHIDQDIIHLTYTQVGNFNIGVFDRTYLKVNYVNITDGISGKTTVWMVNTLNKVVTSGDNNLLYKL